MPSRRSPPSSTTSTMRGSTYSYAYAAQPSGPKYTNGNGTSSAFSPSAHPNEDWTKIADLAERRRIQNRIAQRNYRKKQKRRMEDLERRAGSSSASPPQLYQELSQASTDDAEASEESLERGSALTGRERTAGYRHLSPESSQSGHYLSARDDSQPMFAHQHTRQLSTSPPPFACTPYATQEHNVYYPYSEQASYDVMPATLAPETSLHSQFQPSLSGVLPSQADSIKYESLYAEDDTLSPFSMSYAAMAGVEIPTSQAYVGPNAHVFAPHNFL